MVRGVHGPILKSTTSSDVSITSCLRRSPLGSSSIALILEGAIPALVPSVDLYLPRRRKRGRSRPVRVPGNLQARALSPSPRLAARIQKRQVGRAEHGLEAYRSNLNLLNYLPTSKVTDALRSEPLILHFSAVSRSNHHQITEKNIACCVLSGRVPLQEPPKGSRGTYEPAYTAQLEADSSSLVEQMFSRLQQWSTSVMCQTNSTCMASFCPVYQYIAFHERALVQLPPS